jgi:outer membrane immunogenic protein
MPRLRQVVFCGAVFAASAVGPAVAADLPPSAYPPQAPAAYVPVTPPFSWTGFYVGGNAGYGWSNGSGNLTLGGPGAAGTPDTFSARGNGFVGGGQAGFNWQWAGLVVGMEADFQGSTGSGTLTDGLGNINATVKDPWFGTFRGRVGYAWDRFMVYATGGGVYGNATANGSSTPNAPGAAATAFSSSATYVTWTAGGGVEWAFWGPLSAKVEYLYVGSPSSSPTIPNVSTVTGSASGNIVRGGLNYHF